MPSRSRSRKPHAEDWLIHPLAVAGPEQARLPELTRTLFEAHGDGRQFVTAPQSLQAFGDGMMLASAWAELRGPDVAEWVATAV